MSAFFCLLPFGSGLAAAPQGLISLIQEGRKKKKRAQIISLRKLSFVVAAIVVVVIVGKRLPIISANISVVNNKGQITTLFASILPSIRAVFFFFLSLYQSEGIISHQI